MCATPVRHKLVEFLSVEFSAAEEGRLSLGRLYECFPLRGRVTAPLPGMRKPRKLLVVQGAYDLES